MSLAFFLNLTAQPTSYVPLLDSNVKVLEKVESRKDGKFLWYPGQLSAHLQQIRLRESQERCVNVGYPGNFYKPAEKTFFKKNINLTAPTRIEWKSTGQVKLSDNGKDVFDSQNAYNLSKGRHNLIFEVNTDNNLPAFQVLFDGIPSTENWSASLDGQYWSPAETSEVFGSNGKLPLEDPEVTVEISPVSISPISNSVQNGEKTIIHKNGFILVDFYHLEVGKVTFQAKGKGKLTVYVGESPDETLNENEKLFEQKPIESIQLKGNLEEITLPDRALRYVKIFSDSGCEISDIKFSAKVWPVDFKMSFESSDQEINKIWDASVATLLTSTHGFYLDGIKRDYLPWSMDAVLSTFGGDYVFADEQVSLNSLSVALLPLNPQKSDLGIPDYPLHALIGLKQHYKRYGNFQSILAYRDRIEQLLRFYETIQDDRGFISANVGVSWGFVPGWATRRGPDRKGTPAYAQSMLYYNYKIGAEFSEKWGDKKSAKHFNAKAEKLKESIISHFWDEDKGLFINGYTQKGEIDTTISHHAQYWAILAGIFPEKHYDNLFETLPKIPYYKDYVSFEKGYEFIAYAKANRVRDMWTFLKEVFGDWLDQGHTRFPENFSYKKTKNEQLVFYSRPYGLSLCHGANGVPGIVAVLNGIAGFSQDDLKLNQYTIKPDLMDLEWANIEFPVKEGKIKLNLSKNGESKIEIPAGCEVRVISSKSGKPINLKKSGVYNFKL